MSRGSDRRLHVDWTRGDGHGACSELRPELLRVDEWGFPVPRDGERDPVVPAAIEGRAEHAVRACPLMALRLVTPTPSHARRPAPPR